MSWVAAAVVGGAVIGAGASYLAADKSADAIESASARVSDTESYIYERNRELFEPFYKVGVDALPGLTGYDAAHPLPSFEETVQKPMEDWDYTQSPAYKAKYGLASEELNNQLQARGLTPSAIGANRATDLSRRMTAEDYGNERAYRTGLLTDRFKADRADNTDRYNRLLDMVRVGQGAAGSLGSAGNQYASGVGQATMAAGEARAGFYAGLPGAAMDIASTGLKAYDTGQRAGWWGNNSAATFPQSNSSALPSQAELAPFDSLYG